MSKQFINYNWLLNTTTAQHLYHNHASPQPIIDYHNHLDPQKVATNHKFANLHEAWLAGDHYKWRAMRVAGVEENLITGSASPQEKFSAFAKTVPLTARNPLFHWSHLELQRYFGIGDLLSESNANSVFEKASAQLQTDGNGARDLLEQQKVKLICTTDDPIDSLEHHYTQKHSENALSMRPTFRPDKALQAHKPTWRAYLEELSIVAGVDISDYASLLKALVARMDHFAQYDCRLSDHGLECIPVAQYDPEVADALIRTGEAPKDRATAIVFTFTLMVDLAREYAKRGWTMQLHLGAQRNNNTRAERELGPDTGYDSIGNFPQSQGLRALLNTLNETDELPKTILYNLNPADNHVFATMAGNFCGGGTVAKVQWGAAWWFLDQWDGMQEQVNTLSSVGLLSQFVGMLTDSRSFLSFPRHEYFRRLLCEMLGNDVAAGRLPDDEAWLGKQVEDICYGNASRWFGW